MAADPFIEYGIALDLLDCIAVALADTELGAPERRCVVNGDAIHEGCCGKGQLTVSLIRAFPSVLFPQQFADVSPCNLETVVLELDVTILRCGAQINSAGTAPSCEQQAVTARHAAEDARAIWRAIRCCFEDRDTKITERNHLAPEDGCVGSVTTVYVDSGSACCDAA